MVIITDQQRADHVGFAGNPVVLTPSLDAIAERGTVFERCWVSNPVCMPNRATIVVFTADHGDMMGDHGLLLKGLMHYRGTLQVPLVITDPRREAARTSSLASSIDLGPTLMELCGVSDYHGIQGHSLAPIMDDPAASVRDYVLVEDDLDVDFGGPFPARTRTLVTTTHRYTRHSSGEEGLYELGMEDDERTNLAATEPTLRHEMVDQLVDALLAHSDTARGLYSYST